MDIVEDGTIAKKGTITLDFTPASVDPTSPETSGDTDGGPGGADADLSQVVRALQVAPNSLGGGFGGQADPLGINTGLQSATAESGVQQGNAPASPATQVEAGGGIENVPGEGDADGSPQGVFVVAPQKTASPFLFADKPALQPNFNQLNVEINGLRFNAQQVDFSVVLLEKAVNQLSQIAEDTQGQRDSRIDNMFSDMAVELVEICEEAASNGEDVGYLMIKLDNTRQNQAH